MNKMRMIQSEEKSFKIVANWGKVSKGLDTISDETETISTRQRPRQLVQDRDRDRDTRSQILVSRLRPCLET